MKVLLIKESDLIKYSSINAMVDTDKFAQYIAIAQDIHIENYLGKNLLRRFQMDIENNTPLTTDYQYLLDEYIVPMLIHWSFYEYLPFSAVTIANKGVFKHGAESSETVDDSGINSLIRKTFNTATMYSERFQKYICSNSYKYVEYNTNENGETHPSHNSDFKGWVL